MFINAGLSAQQVLFSFMFMFHKPLQNLGRYYLLLPKLWTSLVTQIICELWKNGLASNIEHLFYFVSIWLQQKYIFMRWQFWLKTLHLEMLPGGPEVLSLIGSRSLWGVQSDAGQCSGLMCGVVHSGSQVSWGENSSLPALRGPLFYTLHLNYLPEEPNKIYIITNDSPLHLHP